MVLWCRLYAAYLRLASGATTGGRGPLNHRPARMTRWTANMASELRGVDGYVSHAFSRRAMKPRLGCELVDNKDAVELT